MGSVHYRLLCILSLLSILVISCTSSGTASEGTGEDQRAQTLVAPTVQEQTRESAAAGPTEVRGIDAPAPTEEAPATDTPAPTEVPATHTPAPTLIQEIEGLVREGTHLVGTDIEPGIYVGLAGEGIMDSCYWARLRNLTGSDDIIANGNAQGLYYVEVVPDDRALETKCELLPIEQVPAREEYLAGFGPGTFLVGRDIEAGTYRGKAGEGILESCYWARLSNVSGADDILANDNATGQYFVEVLPTDFALQVNGEVAKIE